MQLNEIVEENSIATISKRTRISIANIEKLLNRDFSGMNRVKALGFISILEREFDTSLDSLRKDGETYFSAKNDEILDLHSVVSVADPNDIKRFSFKKIFAIVLLIAIGAGAWYFLSLNFNQQTNAQNTTTSASEDNETYAVEKNNTDKNAISTHPKETKPIPVFTKKESQPNSDKNSSNASMTKETNQADSEEKIISDIKKAQAQLSKENNGSEINYDNIPAVEPINSATQTTLQKQQTKEIYSKKNKKKLSEKLSKVILNSTKKLWIGYTNLDTMQRNTKIVDGEISFAPNKKGWIVVTGHSGFNFDVDGKIVASGKKGKAYFLIKQGSVKPISQEEFQKLNKSTVW